MMENGSIALGASLALLLWHLRVNLATEYSSVIEYPRHRKG